MPKLKSLEDLQRVREAAKQEMAARSQADARIIVAMGTCGIAAGAREVMRAILDELAASNIRATVETTGCVGMCAKEPLVDVEITGKSRVTYANVKPDMVPRIIDQHVRRGEPVWEWATGRPAAFQ